MQHWAQTLSCPLPRALPPIPHTSPHFLYVLMHRVAGTKPALDISPLGKRRGELSRGRDLSRFGPKKLRSKKNMGFLQLLDRLQSSSESWGDERY